MFQSQILSAGVELMCYGMGVVFLFLTLLFLATSVMSACIRACFPEQRQAQGEGASREHIAAITAAVHRYRGKYLSR